MNITLFFDSIPIWAIYILTILLLMLGYVGGFQLGLLHQKRTPDEVKGPAGTTIGAILALSGFLLAFVIGLATSRYDNRRLLVVTEVNAIGTTWLRAGYLEEPYKSEVRLLLMDYVDERVKISDDSQRKAAFVNSEKIHDQLWLRAEELAIAHPDSEMVGLFIITLNEMIDVHTSRYTAIDIARLPPTIIYEIYLIALVSLGAVGYFNGLAGKRTLVPILALVLVFAAVMVLIIDLDRPFTGWLRSNQQPMLELQIKLRQLIK